MGNLLIGIVMLILGFAGGFFLTRNTTTNTTPQSSVPVVQTPQPSVPSVQNWNTNSTLGPFKFDYPKNWHVESDWGANMSKDGVSVWMDPNPIDGGPRDGPKAEVLLNWKNGLTNASSDLQSQITAFKSNLTNVTEEDIKGAEGTIYHFVGTFGPGQLSGEKSEIYLMLIKEQDSINDTVIRVESNLNKVPVDTLRHIVLSIGKRT